MRKFYILAVLFFLVITSYSQEGRITGKVIDAASGQALVSATITLIEKSKTIAADQNGIFTFTKLTPGKYSIRCSYAGYTEKVVEEIEVKENDNSSVTISLEQQKMGEVVITTSKVKAAGENVSSLLIAQKNNASVSDGISAETIKRTPDRTTGDVLKRVSGASIQDDRFAIIRGLNDRYNAAYINGAPLPSTESDRKAFAFDIFPSSILDNLIIYKTATADRSGEFAGGVIDIATKSILPKKFTSFSYAGSYNTLLTGNNRFYSENLGSRDWIGKDNGLRSLPDGFPSTVVLRGSTPDERATYAKQFNNYKWGIKSRVAKPDYNIQFSKGFNIERKQKDFAGVLVALNYKESFTLNGGERNTFPVRGKFADSIYNNEIVLAALVNISVKINNRNILSLKNNLSINTDNRVIKRTGAPDLDSDPNTIVRDIVRAYSSNQIFCSQLNGEHLIGKHNTKLNWLASFAKVNREVPNYSRTSYYGDSISKGTAFINDNPSQITGSGTMFFASTDESIKSIKMDISQPYKFMKNSQNVLKIGSGYQLRERNFTSRLLGFAPYRSPGFDNTLVYLPEDQIFLPEHIGLMKNSKGGFQVNDGTSPNPDYDASSSVIHGYIMNDQRFYKKFRFIYGLRVERFQQKLNSPSGFISIPPLVIDSVVTDFLPSANLVYAITPKTNIRLSYSQTVNRPEFRELAPFVFYDYQAQYSLSGDPKLKRAKISNYDFRYEYFPGRAQLFSVSAFYKEFTNPIEIIFVPGIAIATQAAYTNSVSATLLGFEAEIRTLLSTILGSSKETGILNKITLYANAAYMKSKVKLPFVSGTGTVSRIDADRPMQGQSPYLLNGAITFQDDESGLTCSFAFNKAGDRLSVGGIKDEVADIYEKGRTILDLQLAKFFFKNTLELKFTARDLLAQKFIFYFDNDKTKSFGGTDISFSSYNAPKVFTLSATLKF